MKETKSTTKKPVYPVYYRCELCGNIRHCDSLIQLWIDDYRQGERRRFKK